MAASNVSSQSEGREGLPDIFVIKECLKIPYWDTGGCNIFNSFADKRPGILRPVLIGSVYNCSDCGAVGNYFI